MHPHRSVAVLVLAVSCCASSTWAQQTPPACAGDCGGDGKVSVADLVTMVDIALERRAASACAAGIPSGATMTVALLVEGVSHSLDGCPIPGETRTPRPTFTPTSAPTATPVPPTPTDTPELPTPTATDTPIPHHFCDLPGSVVTTVPGIAVVPGGPPGTPDLSFLHLPAGFCAHFYAHVGNVRQMRFAPGGELFVASPTKGTTGGGQGGQSAIIVLPDDDQDGVADAPVTFLDRLPATQGLLFNGGYFYYQDDTRIMRLPYTPGQRSSSNRGEQVLNVTVYVSITTHWPKTLDANDDGTIYVGNGGDETETCDPSHPFHGGILRIDGSAGGAQVARGFRNPISIRCAKGHNMCFAIELTRDYTTPVGGREKLVPIRDGDDWGFPCCATHNIPFPDIVPAPDCSMVAMEIDSFFVGHTPFDLDFEQGKWPEPWKNHVYVPLHGAYNRWLGAGVVAIDFDAMTGTVLPGSDLTGTFSGAMSEFASGWAETAPDHGRPANVVFAPDGRLFLGNDYSGDIIWIAPTTL